MFTIKTYTPKLSVVAWHGTTAHDLTPYVLQVNTHKSLAEPMGQWSVLLTMEKEWHKILSNMDYVEIKMSRIGDPKIIMRGFISNRRRTKVIDRSGKIRKTITINGNDYGKLIQQYEVYYVANIPGQLTPSSDVFQGPQLQDTLAEANLGILPNMSDSLTPLKLLIPSIVGSTITPWIKAMQSTTPIIPLLRPLVQVLDDYQLSWITLQSMTGSIGTVIDQYANLPWCEWFVFDAQDGPIIIHRNTPFKDKDGKYIFAESELGSEWWPSVTIIDEDIIEDDVGSSDAEAYNYFFTYPSLFPEGDLQYKAFITSGDDMFGPGTVEEKTANMGNETFPSNPKFSKESVYRYGLQIMSHASPAIPILGVDSLSVQLSVKMNMWLFKAFSWAPDMLNGTLRLKGNPDITIGRYLFNSDSKEEGYIESVDHVFGVSQLDSKGNDGTFYYETTVGVSRGRYAVAPSSGSLSSGQLSSPSYSVMPVLSGTESSEPSLDYTDPTSDQSDKITTHVPQILVDRFNNNSLPSSTQPSSNSDQTVSGDPFIDYLLKQGQYSTRK